MTHTGSQRWVALDGDLGVSVMGIWSALTKSAIESQLDLDRATLTTMLADRAAGKKVRDEDIRTWQRNVSRQERELRRMEEDRLREQAETDRRRQDADRRRQEREQIRSQEEAQHTWQREDAEGELRQSAAEELLKVIKEIRSEMASPTGEAETLKNGLCAAVSRNDVQAAAAFLKANSQGEFALKGAVDAALVDEAAPKDYFQCARLLAAVASKSALAEALAISIERGHPDVAVHMMKVLKSRGETEGVESPLIQVLQRSSPGRMEIMFEALLPYGSIDDVSLDGEDSVLTLALGALNGKAGGGNRELYLSKRQSEHIFNHCRILPLPGVYQSILALAVYNEHAFFTLLKRLELHEGSDELASYWASQVEVRNGRTFNRELQLALREVFLFQGKRGDAYFKVKDYLMANCDLGVADEEGRTPLMWAASDSGDLYVDEALLKASDLSACDPSGRTAYDIARETTPWRNQSRLNRLKPPLMARMRAGLMGEVVKPNQNGRKISSFTVFFIWAFFGLVGLLEMSQALKAPSWEGKMTAVLVGTGFLLFGWLIIRALKWVLMAIELDKKGS